MSHRRPRVLLATTSPLSLSLFYVEVAREFRRRGFEVHACCSPGEVGTDVRSHLDALHVLPMRRGVSVGADLRALRRWVQLVAQVRPTVVLAASPKAALLAMTAAALQRVDRRVYHLIGLRLEGARGPLAPVLATMERATAWCSHTVVAVSPSLADEFARRRLSMGRPVAVPGNGSTHGVDCARFAPRRRDHALAERLGLDPTVPTLVFVGRLTADKGPAELVAAGSRLRRRAQNFQLLIVGPCDERDSERSARALSESGIPLVFTGFQADVRPFLALGDVLVLPTHREGLPNAVLEAAAMGLPSVTTRATGAVDAVVDGVTGFTVAVGDSDTLADRLELLLRDADLRARLGEAARAWVMQRFVPEEVARRTVDLVTDVNREPSAREQARPSR